MQLVLEFESKHAHNLRHGHCRRSLGAAGVSAEYRAWRSMIDRCTRKAHERWYKGVEIYGPWRQSFELFFAHVGKKPSPHHTLDRIKSTEGYVPGNVRWATKLEQTQNRSNTKTIEIDGVTRTIAEWSELTGTRYQTIFYRMNHGWSAKDAVFKAAQPGRPRTRIDQFKANVQ